MRQQEVGEGGKVHRRFTARTLAYFGARRGHCCVWRLSRLLIALPGGRGAPWWWCLARPRGGEEDDHLPRWKNCWGVVWLDYHGGMAGPALLRQSSSQSSSHPYVSFSFRFLGGEKNLEEVVVGGRMGGGHICLVLPAPVHQHVVRHPDHREGEARAWLAGS